MRIYSSHRPPARNPRSSAYSENRSMPGGDDDDDDDYFNDTASVNGTYGY